MQNQTEISPADNALAKRQILWILLALFFVIGWFSAIITEDASYYALFQIFTSLATTIFVLRWVALDAVERKFKLTASWGIAFLFFSLLAMPFYLARTRGKNALRPIAMGAGLMLGYTLVLALGKGIATAIGL